MITYTFTLCALILVIVKGEGKAILLIRLIPNLLITSHLFTIDFTSLFTSQYTDLTTDTTQVIPFQNSTLPLQFTKYRIYSFKDTSSAFSISMWVQALQLNYYQGRKIPLYLASSTLTGSVDYSDSKNVRLLLSAQGTANGLELVFETYLNPVGSNVQCFSSANPVADNSEWFFIYHSIDLVAGKSTCYVYFPSKTSQMEMISTITTGHIGTITIGNDFSIFLGGILRPGFANWFGSVSQPRLYLDTYYDNPKVICKLHMLGTYTEIYREYLSTNTQLGQSLLQSDYNFQKYQVTGNGQNTFLIDGYTYIQFSFKANNNWPLVQILMQLIPVNPQNNNRIILDVLNQQLRIIFNGDEALLGSVDNTNKSYTLRLFFYKPLGESILMVHYFLIDTKSNLKSMDFIWQTVSNKIDTTGGFFSNFVGNNCSYQLRDVILGTFYCTQCIDPTKFVGLDLTNPSCIDCQNALIKYNDSIFCQSLVLNMIQCIDTVNCLQCKNTPDQCSICKDSYFVNSKICSKCNSNCSLCQSSTQCTKCNTNYALSNNLCVSCKNFDSDCQTCQTSGCTQCTTKILDHTQTCVDQCSNGYYLQTNPIQQCINCNINCLSCTLTQQNKENCLICQDKIIQNGIQYQIFEDLQDGILSCVLTCRLGYYSNSLSSQCEQCAQNLCISCQDSSDNCTQCDTNSLQLDTVDLLTNNAITLCTDDCINYKVGSPQAGQSYIINQKINNPAAAFYANATLKKCFSCEQGCTACNQATYSGCTAADNQHTFNNGDQNYYFSNKCQDGFYYQVQPLLTDQSTTFTTCLNCNGNCQTCQSFDQIKYTTPDGKKCTSCNSLLYLDITTSTCVSTCPSRYFSNKSTNVCDPCYPDCQECNGPTSDQCMVACLNGIRQVGVDPTGTVFSCVLNCSQGYYLDQVSSQCLKCGIQCKACQQYDQCSSCADNYYRGPVIAGNNYMNCLSDCKLAKQVDQFDQSHMIGYFNNPIGNICSECHSYCSACQSASLLDCTECTKYQNVQFYLQLTNSNSGVGYCTQTCLDGYIQSLNSNVCQTCSAECLTCTNTQTNCTSCKSGKYLKKGSTNYTCVDQNNCGDGEYGDRYSLNCTNCDSSCKTCSSTSTNCTSCQTTKLKGNKCIDPNQYCGDGYFDSTDSKGLLLCQQCDVSCLKCFGSSISCTACKLGQFALNQQCVSEASCIANFKIPNYSTGVCQQCSDGCAQCITSISNCISCKSDSINKYYLQSQSKCVKDCDLGYYKTTENSINVCKQCFSSCSKCVDGTENTCSACKSKYYLTSKSECVATKNCPDGYYGDDLTNICKSCHPKCATCFNPNNNQCNSCNKGFFLFNSSCKGCSDGCSDCDSIDICKTCNKDGGYFYYNSTCLKICPIGYFGDFQQSISCIKCDKQCSSCSQSGSNCLACSQGYFKNGLVCTQCPTNCAICTNSSTCTMCVQGTYKIGISSTCSNTCPLGQYGSSTSLKCEQCNTSCSQCDGPYEFNCLQCSDSTKVVKDGVCLNILECLGAYYLDQKNGGCYPCDQGCLSCSGSSSNCDLCDTNYYLTQLTQDATSEKRCYQTCPPGFLPKTAQRDQGNTDLLNYCDRCQSSCKICAAPQYLYVDQCVYVCPSGYTGNPSQNICQKLNNIFCQINNPSSSSLFDSTNVISLEGYLTTSKPIYGMKWTLVEKISSQVISQIVFSNIASNTFNLKEVFIIAPNQLLKGTQYTLTLSGSIISSETCQKSFDFKTSSPITQGIFSFQAVSLPRIDQSIQIFQFSISGFATSDSGQQLLFDVILVNSQSNKQYLIAQRLQNQPIQFNYQQQNLITTQQFIPYVIAYTDNSKLQVRAQNSISTTTVITKPKALSQINAIISAPKYKLSNLDDINYLTNLFYQSYFSDFYSSQKSLIIFQSFFDVFDSLNGNYQSTCQQSFFCNNNGQCGDAKQFQRECLCNAGYSGKNCQYITSEFTSIQNLNKAIISSTLMSTSSSNSQDSILKLTIIRNMSIGKDILSYSDLRYLLNVFFDILNNTEVKLNENSFQIIQETIQNLLRSLCSSSSITINDKKNINSLVEMYQNNIFQMALKLAAQKTLLVDDIFAKYEIIYLNSRNVPPNSSTNDVYTIQSQISTQSYQIPLNLLITNSTVMYFVAIQWNYDIFNQYTSYNQFSTSLFSSVNIIDSQGTIINVSGFDSGLLIQLAKNYNYSPLIGSPGAKIYRCAYIEQYTNKWQETGCTFVSETINNIVCKCTHFTTFSAQAIPFNLLKKPSQTDILMDNGWKNLQEFLSNQKEGIVVPDTGDKEQQEKNSKNKWFPNPIGVYVLLFLTGIYLMIAYVSIWIINERENTHPKTYITYHPVMSILLGQNSQEVSTSMKWLQLFLQLSGIFFFNSFLGDSMSVIVRAILSLIITCLFHSLIFYNFNHFRCKKVVAQYPGHAYLSEIDQINLAYKLRQYKFIFYMICFLLYLIEGIGLAIQANQINTNQSASFIGSSVLAFFIDILIIDSAFTFIAAKLENKNQKVAYFFKLRGFYDFYAKAYSRVKQNDSGI